MEIVILPTPAEVGRLAARKIGQVIVRKPTAVIGLATGSSPLAIYAELAASVRDGLLDARQVRGVALDEYVGIPADHPESYRSVLTRKVTEPLGLDPRNVFVPDGRAADIPAACAAYEATDPRPGRGRHPDPGHRRQRAHRLQRAHVVVRVSHPDQDPRPADPRSTTPGSSPTRTRCRRTA